jgi:hypothetical protein
MAPAVVAAEIAMAEVALAVVAVEIAMAEVAPVVRRSIASPQLPGVVASVAGRRSGKTRDRQGQERPDSEEPHWGHPTTSHVDTELSRGQTQCQQAVGRSKRRNSTPLHFAVFHVG